MWVEGVNIKTMFYSAPDPDFEIGGGGGHPDPYLRGGGGRSPKKFFSARLPPPPDPPVLLIVNLTVISPYSLIKKITALENVLWIKINNL